MAPPPTPSYFTFPPLGSSPVPPPPHLSPSNFQIFCSIFLEAIKQPVLSPIAPHLAPPPTTTTTASPLLPPSVNVFAHSRRRCGCGGGQSEPSDARSEVKPPRRRSNILTGCISGAPRRNRTGTSCAASGADDSASHQRTRQCRGGAGCHLLKQCVPATPCAASLLKCGRRRQREEEKRNGEPQLRGHITDVSSQRYRSA